MNAVATDATRGKLLVQIYFRHVGALSLKRGHHGVDGVGDRGDVRTLGRPRSNVSGDQLGIGPQGDKFVDQGGEVGRVVNDVDVGFAQGCLRNVVGADQQQNDVRIDRATAGAVSAGEPVAAVRIA